MIGQRGFEANLVVVKVKDELIGTVMDLPGLKRLFQVYRTDVEALLGSTKPLAVRKDTRLISLVAICVKRHTPVIDVEVAQSAKVCRSVPEPLDELFARLAAICSGMLLTNVRLPIGINVAQSTPKPNFNPNILSRILPLSMGENSLPYDVLRY